MPTQAHRRRWPHHGRVTGGVLIVESFRVTNCLRLASLCYDSAPSGEPLLPENMHRSKLPSTSTTIIVSWHNGLCINAAAYCRM